MSFRTDRNSNPTAFTTDVAKQAGLILGIDYEQGEPFKVSSHSMTYTYYTAKILKDPIEATIKVIDKIGFYNSHGQNRWIYIAIPYQLWHSLNETQKKYVIGYMYNQEGGIEMKHLFPQDI
jgi:hypothetical protein